MAAFENIQEQPQLDPRSAGSMAASCASATGHARSTLGRALASGSIRNDVQVAAPHGPMTRYEREASCTGFPQI